MQRKIQCKSSTHQNKIIQHFQNQITQSNS